MLLNSPSGFDQILLGIGHKKAPFHRKGAAQARLKIVPQLLLTIQFRSAFRRDGMVRNRFASEDCDLNTAVVAVLLQAWRRTCR